MLPETEVLQTRTEPDLTYAVNFDTGQMTGRVEGLDAMRQAVLKALMTERCGYVIYTDGYGLQSADLPGRDATEAPALLPMRIRDCLMADARVESVDGFSTVRSGGQVEVTFTVHTSYGAIDGAVWA